MSLASYLQFAAAFGFVLALIALAALAARRFGLGHAPRSIGERRLAISEATPLDARHKLVLVRRDAVEHLIVLGPAGAAVLESGIGERPSEAPARPMASFATALSEAF